MNTRNYSKIKSITADLVKAAPYLHDAIMAAGPESVYNHANEALRAPFPGAEKVIAGDAYWAYLYALNVLGGPFLAAEETIAGNNYYSRAYARRVNKNFQVKGHSKGNRWHAHFTANKKETA